EFEKSIHKAYLQAIARAADFMYIETQYLIGESKLKANSTNRIPKAIVDRILAMNRLQKDFHVYIVTPLYPEGDPLDKPVQPVRYNQWETMKWMENQLANLQNNKQWTDYLSFYFLGQRHGAVDANYPNNGTRQQRIANSNRYMIYVHSKLMIVDDRWIILGSANLNERSMAGNRDSEICVAMWPTPGHQDAQTAADKIKAFRKKLWEEHLVGSENYAMLHNSFDAPQAAATVTNIRTAAERNFNEFIKNAAPNNMGHLMYWDWSTIDTGHLPDSPAGENKLLWAPTELGLPPVVGNVARLAEWSPDGFR
ncbi:MAG TPA: phospholipase D-like domain-containing protein, partial [Candidatus Saccharimonadia bacterium]|nr:phospholipase D-like domain-containing protein [Candidatus Saccharimonadia bacterium]